MTFLFDINVLIALIDPAHTQHDVAHEWFGAYGKKSWATCPLTENGVLRILGSPRYPNSPGTPKAVVELMKILCSLPGHAFWSDNISLLDDHKFDYVHLLASPQITDTYLLALACSHSGQLATFDQRLITTTVRHCKQGVHLIS